MGFKNKKQMKEEAAAAARAEAEFKAKYTAKQEKRNVEKNISEIDKSIAGFIARAAEAKSKGYTDMYRKCISFIKVARMRKKQAEMFLFQIDAMQEMQSISKNSNALLGSIKNIMTTLGGLSVDKAVISAMSGDFQKTQMELDKQSGNIEMALSGLEMQMPYDEDDADSLADSEIEREIDNYAASNSVDVSEKSETATEKSIDSEMDYLQSLLKN